MDSKLEISLLYDFYGGLIPAPQQRVVELYVNDDLSLSEAADNLGISRQGVRDALNRAGAKLRAYEQQLGLLRLYRERKAAAAAIRESVGAIRTRTDDEEIRARCDLILKYTEMMNEREGANGL